ncbi:MAG: hypothetical protein FWD87_01290 [Spirochaetaceae bacterium]|nr:hypothetical protein [Spirochaetaceae bacterium]
MIGHHGLLFIVVWPIIAAFICYLIGRRSKDIRDYFACFAVLLELFVVLIIAASAANNSNPPVFEWFGFMGYKIHLKMDGFRAIYAIITAFMWAMTTLFSREYFAHYRNRNRYYFFSMLTLGGTMGTFLSADLVTTFLFFEIMSFSSYVMVVHDERPATIKAANTYMAVAVIGGLALIFGIFIISNLFGTTEISALFEAARNFEGNKTMLYVAAAFLLVGFGGKAGMYPIHIWLPNAHPVAPAPASALLSGVLTKTGIFGIIIMSALIFYQDYNWGMAMLILGVAGMFTGALLALFSIDLKRTFACSSVSQIGFIMVGIGMQCVLSAKYAPLAIQGTMLHMVNHSLIKLVLFLVAGVVYVNLHELDLNKVRGFGRGKPLLTFSFLMGALSIIGIPLWSGYISKKLLQKSIAYHIESFADYSIISTFFQSLEGIFILTGGLTTAYMIKIFICLFLEKNQFDDAKMTLLNKKYIATGSAAVLVFSALTLPILGFRPSALMIPIAKFGQNFMLGTDFYTNVSFFDAPTLLGALPSLAIGIIVYILIVRCCLMAKDEKGRSIYVNRWPAWIDIEEKIYRPLLMVILPFICAMLARTIGSIVSGVSMVGYKIFVIIKKFWRIKLQRDWVSEKMKDINGFFNTMTARMIELEEGGKRYIINLNNQPKKIMKDISGHLEDYKIRTVFSTLGYSLKLCLAGAAIVLLIVVLYLGAS